MGEKSLKIPKYWTQRPSNSLFTPQGKKQDKRSLAASVATVGLVFPEDCLLIFLELFAFLRLLMPLLCSRVPPIRTSPESCSSLATLTCPSTGERDPEVLFLFNINVLFSVVLLALFKVSRVLKELEDFSPLAWKEHSNSTSFSKSKRSMLTLMLSHVALNGQTAKGPWAQQRVVNWKINVLII